MIPDCELESGCPIPDLSAEGARLLGVRDLLAELKESVGPETVCRLCDVDREDLALLAVIEQELRAAEKPAGDNAHGEGH